MEGRTEEIWRKRRRGGRGRRMEISQPLVFQLTSCTKRNRVGNTKGPVNQFDIFGVAQCQIARLCK